MQKTVVGLSKTLIMWMFFLSYKGHGHEQWNWLKAIGMIVMAFGLILYVKLDIE